MKKLDFGQTIGILANVGVLVGIILLVVELRQNNQTNVRTATQEMLRDYADVARSLSGDTEMSCIYLRGNQSFEQLSELEKFRYSSHMLHYYRSVQAMHDLMRQGLIDPDAWRSADSITRETLQRPGVRQWIVTRYHWFTDDFRTYLEDAVGNSPETDFITYEPEGCPNGGN